MHYRVTGDLTSPPMTAADVLQVAEIAYGGGLIEEMPANAEEAVDAFECIGIEIETINEGTDAVICEECGERIPDQDGGSIVNRYHKPSCSLFDQENP